MVGCKSQLRLNPKVNEDGSILKQHTAKKHTSHVRGQSAVIRASNMVSAF